PVVSRPANQTTVVAAAVLCTAGAVAAPLPTAAPAAGVVAAPPPPLAPPPPQAASTPALADIASPRNRLRRLSRACHRRSSLTVLTPSVRPFAQPPSRHPPCVVSPVAWGATENRGAQGGDGHRIDQHRV